MTDKEVINYLAETNDYKYNLLKAAEELQELALVLTQTVLKKNKVDKQEIIDEIGDVKIRLKVLEKLFCEDKQSIIDRMNYKLNKFREYISKGKYKGGI